ncbi:MAG: hypothetical protein EBT63_00270 [Proteobacteria bacterium]|nr:hypothetical protein [Pseudomonadota bacterium]
MLLFNFNKFLNDKIIGLKILVLALIFELNLCSIGMNFPSLFCLFLWIRKYVIKIEIFCLHLK